MQPPKCRPRFVATPAVHALLVFLTNRKIRKWSEKCAKVCVRWEGASDWHDLEIEWNLQCVRHWHCDIIGAKSYARIAVNPPSPKRAAKFQFKFRILLWIRHFNWIDTEAVICLFTALASKTHQSYAKDTVCGISLGWPSRKIIGEKSEKIVGEKPTLLRLNLLVVDSC